MFLGNNRTTVKCFFTITQGNNRVLLIHVFYILKLNRNTIINYCIVSLLLLKTDDMENLTIKQSYIAALEIEAGSFQDTCFLA